MATASSSIPGPTAARQCPICICMFSAAGDALASWLSVISIGVTPKVRLEPGVNSRGSPPLIIWFPRLALEAQAGRSTRKMKRRAEDSGAPSLRKYSSVPPEPAKPEFSTLYTLFTVFTGCSSLLRPLPRCSGAGGWAGSARTPLAASPRRSLLRQPWPSDRPADAKEIR